MASQEQKPNFRFRKEMFIHNYDLFLEKQVRLLAYSRSQLDHSSDEIDLKSHLLLLDDITIFAISFRRLLHLSNLSSIANRAKIFPIKFFPEDKINPIRREDNPMGLATILNKIIHMRDFAYIEKPGIMALPDERSVGEQISIIQKFLQSDEYADLRKYKSAIYLEEKSEKLYFILEEIILASIRVADIIVEHCEESGVILSIFMRT